MLKIAPPIRSCLAHRLTVGRIFSVGVERMLNIFSVRQKFQVFQPVVRSVQVLVVYLHAFRYGTNKGFPHRPVNCHLDVLPVFARAKPNVMVSCHMGFNRPSPTVSRPRLSLFNGKSGSDARTQEVCYVRQRSAVSKHGFSLVHLFGGKSLSSGHTAHTPRVADFVQAFVAKNGFPRLHAVDINPIYVEGQA